jgi:pyridoxine 5-phosphate synthase
MSRALLSVNVNKYALLRNSRGHGQPDLRHAIDLACAAGAHGITVHPRRDERHVRMSDLPVVADHLRTRWPGRELNVECEDHPDLVRTVIALRPDQCTLVPVTPGEVTSDHGWSLPGELARLRPVVAALRGEGIRTSLFADCDVGQIARFAETGADRVELYTGPFAWAWGTPDAARETARVWESAAAAVAAGLGVNAGHDLDRHNLAGLRDLPGLREVSIGHAQIVRALEVGTDASVRELLVALGYLP